MSREEYSVLSGFFREAGKHNLECRGLKVDERETLARTLFEIQGGSCFICERPVDLNLQEWEIDHVVPRAKGGKDEKNNFALVHKSCNRSKLDSDLRVARCMAKYERIKDSCAERGPNRPNLGDFLTVFGGAKDKLRVRVSGGWLEYSLPGNSVTVRVPIHKDSLAEASYVFLVLPIECLYHDERINPRAVGDRVRGLVEEFLAGRPQLHISLAWSSTEDGYLCPKVFDGQHKVVAQMLLGVREFPVRVFLNPDLDVLLETNTRAGTVLRQVAFDRSVQRYLGSQIYWEKVDEFRRSTGRTDEDLDFSEQDLVKFFKGQYREVKRYILDDVRTSVIHSADNKLRDYVEFGGKATEKPLSYSTVEKTFFSLFIHKDPMSVPLGYKLEVGENPRQLEKTQLVQLMNIFAEEIFIGKYDFDRGTYRIEEGIRKGEDIRDDHLRAVRVAREEVLYNILRYVRDCIKRFYLMQGTTVEEEDLFQQRFPDLLWDHLQRLVRNFAALPVWVNRNPTLSSAVFGGKQSYDFWKCIFDTGDTPGGLKVLIQRINLDDLLK